MNLVYWYAKHKTDSNVYSVVAKTKKACIAEVNANGAENYEAPERRVINYSNAFDLFKQVTGEGGGRGYGFRRP